MKSIPDDALDEGQGRKWTPLIALLPALLFPVAAFVIGARSPSSFGAPSLIGRAPYLLIGTAAAALVFRRSRPARENAAGLLLFLLFTAGYFQLGSLLNRPDINTNNVYFAADNLSWYQRMANLDGWTVGTRAVHPLTYILFRPLIAALSLLTAGDRFHATLALLAAAGGGCVFLAWKIVKASSGYPDYPILFASLLGLSASHLVFASVVESYIFSALGLLIFLWLLMTNKPDYLLVPAGLVTFGITLTNTVQQALASLIVLRQPKRVVKVFLAIGVIAVGLSVLSKIYYPLTEYFFLPQNLAGESRFSQAIDLKRAGLLLENLLIFCMAAPQPFMSMRNGMPRFNFLSSSLGDMIWFGQPALMIWVVLLTAAVIRYSSRRQSNPVSRALATSLLVCLAFNYLLHLGYGVEPFLYTANWTYALVLFTAAALQDLAGNGRLRLLLFLLVSSLLVNNLWLLYLLTRQVSRFLV